jgi:hypothetical protein
MIGSRCRLSQRLLQVVAAFGAVFGEIDGHLQRITLSESDLNGADCDLKIFSVSSRNGTETRTAGHRHRPIVEKVQASGRPR